MREAERKLDRMEGADEADEADDDDDDDEPLQPKAAPQDKEVLDFKNDEEEVFNQ